ncbi:MAG TPA: hypothetical protein VL979_10080 [Solirubrobacteraceae bacterium]|nr:hypothetical protein [Solirubrobacteraceae bacterium]
MTAHARSMAGAIATAALAYAIALLACAPALAEEATWSGLEQPRPPGASGSAWPVGLGYIGDVEFYAPDRGVLITDGEEPTVPKGIWAYNGVEWHEYAIECGASDGRVAWAGPSEFWTVSDGRPGQANEIGPGGEEIVPPREDNTLCHFAGGAIAGSYAHPAFQADSYQAMSGAACLGPSDCWFVGAPLAEPQLGAFQLHWNGSSLGAEPYPEEGHAAEALTPFEGALFESVLLAAGDRVSEEKPYPPVLHRINPQGFSPPMEAEEGPFGEGLPLYQTGEPAKALSYLRLSQADGALWAAAGATETGLKDEKGEVTVIRDVGGEWTQLIGPGDGHGLAAKPLGPVLASPSEEVQLLGGTEAQATHGGTARYAVVDAIAAEPGTDSAWLALSARGPLTGQRAVLVHIDAEGDLLEEQTLPSAAEESVGIGPKGAVTALTCPAVEDCWTGTAQGWLFHRATAGERRLIAEGALRDPRESEYFSGEVISYRPKDQGLPQVVPDAPPADDSGVNEEIIEPEGAFKEQKQTAEQPKVELPLLSRVRSRLVHGSELELRFHLAVMARVRLLARRRGRVIARTPTHTFKAGERKLMLALDRHRWPTKLTLQTKALAPLPLVSSVTGEGAGVTTETTGLSALPRVSPMGGPGTLP